MTDDIALPEFSAPPLIEVVLGVQFAPQLAYSQIRAKEVWDLYREDYPGVQEMPPLDPVFETFGRQQTQALNIEVFGARHDRFWFISEDGHQLIQFQADRLLHNWRKMAAPTARSYPRFEGMLPRFQQELMSLEHYFRGIGGMPLQPNQCEVTYINSIALPPEGPCQVDQWVNFLRFGETCPDELQFSMRHILQDGQDRIGRLHIEAKVGTKPDHSRVLQLNLTARGVPPQPTVAGALDFLRLGRNLIVRKFAEITTESAHKVWERTR